jgi:uncharacterized protein YukE
MADHFSARPATLRAAGAQFTTAGSDLSAALGQLTATLGGLGDICGDDEQGQQFAASYNPNVGSIEAAVRNIAQGLVSVDGGLMAMADNYEHTDHAKASSFRFHGGGG